MYTALTLITSEMLASSRRVCLNVHGFNIITGEMLASSRRACLNVHGLNTYHW